MNELGKKLLDLRHSHKKTQKEVADYINTTYQNYAHYEKGRHSPDPETLSKLAEYYNVSIDYLLNRDENISYDHINNNINIPNDYKEIPVALYHAAKGLTQKEADAVVSFIELIKSNKDEDKK